MLARSVLPCWHESKDDVALLQNHDTSSGTRFVHDRSTRAGKGRDAYESA